MAGRMTNAEKDYKQSQGKDLFVKGYTIQSISEMLDVGIKTLSKWRDEKDWENEKGLNNIRPSEIKKMILEYVKSIKDGKKPKYKPDDLAKIAAAFDRLSDKRKQAVYAMETFNDFAGFMLEKAGKQQGKKREDLLKFIKDSRVFFDQFITLLLQDD